MLAAINKPPALSSAGVLRKLQEHFDPSKFFAPLIAAEQSKRAAESRSQQKKRKWRGRQHPKVKLGHGGTLDPLATGVLAVGIGNGTKSLSQFLECTKGYECVLLFGAATDTYDRLGKIVGRAPYGHVSQEKVEEALGRFRGKIMQKPPIFSALRVEGKKMYEYAREGKKLPIEIQERPVEVTNLEIVEWMDGGTHGHELPKTEVDGEEKIVANELLHLDEATRPSSIGKLENDTLQAETGTKRTHLDSEEDDIVEDASFKRARLSSGSPRMSGALKPDEGTFSVAFRECSQERKTGQHMSDDIKDDQSHDDDRVPPSSPPAVKLRMTVSSGFYVRSLCHDIGAAVGSLGLMSELIRTRQGVFELGKNVLDYDSIEKGEDIWAPKVQDSLEAWSTELSGRAGANAAIAYEQSKDRGRNSSSEMDDRP